MFYIKVKWEVVCAVSNDDIADNLGWPITTQITLFYTFLFGKILSQQSWTEVECHQQCCSSVDAPAMTCYGRQHLWYKLPGHIWANMFIAKWLQHNTLGVIPALCTMWWSIGHDADEQGRHGRMVLKRTWKSFALSCWRRRITGQLSDQIFT